MEKATKEAKQHTSWVNPNEEYDARRRRLRHRHALADPVQESLPEIVSTLRPPSGLLRPVHSLAQSLFKLTAPACPTSIRATNSGTSSLVDPDNRRPVDFQTRQRILEECRPLLEGKAPDLSARVAELLSTAVDGRIKLYITARLLRLRRDREALFQSAAYNPLTPVGTRAAALCAFDRRLNDQRLTVAACIRPVGCTNAREVPPLGSDSWKETFLPLTDLPPEATFTEVLTGRTLKPIKGPASSRGFWARDLFTTLPIAVLTGPCQSPQS